MNEGYLVKRPNDATVFGQWKKRWFVLKAAQGTMVYYKTKEEARVRVFVCVCLLICVI